MHVTGYGIVRCMALYHRIDQKHIEPPRQTSAYLYARAIRIACRPLCLRKITVHHTHTPVHLIATPSACLWSRAEAAPAPQTVAATVAPHPLPSLARSHSPPAQDGHQSTFPLLHLQASAGKGTQHRGARRSRNKKGRPKEQGRKRKTPYEPVTSDNLWRGRQPQEKNQRKKKESQQTKNKKAGTE